MIGAMMLLQLVCKAGQCRRPMDLSGLHNTELSAERTPLCQYVDRDSGQDRLQSTGHE